MSCKLDNASGALLVGAILLSGSVAHAKKPTVGSAKEYATKSAGADPEGLVVSHLGFVWYTEQATNAIVVATSNLSVQVEYTIPTANAGPVGIVQGSDGKIWFTETVAGQIGQVDILGNFKEFAIPNAAVTTLTVLAAGSDGNLWFPEEFGNNIDVMDTTGTLLNQYAIPTAGAQPFAIVAGPDGNLWFSETAVNSVGDFNIGKITTAGVITEYDIGQFEVNQLAAGTDGNIWFTDNMNNAVGVFNIKKGTATEYSVSGANPEGICAGADQNMWFAESDGNNVARITPKGVVTEYALPTSGGNPEWIAPASTILESNEPYVYVSETIASQIARVYVSDVDKDGGCNEQ